MSLLLDTHYVYGFAAGMDGLSAAERRYFQRKRGPFVVSAVAIWELRIKWNVRRRSGQRKGPIDPETALRVLVEFGLEFLPLTPLHGATSLHTPLGHADPFDELLVVQAQVEGMKLVSRDQRLVDHPLVVAI